MNRHGVTEPAALHSRRFPFLLVLAYLVVGSLWILVSDELAVRFADSAAELDRWQGIKGWGFVLVTAALLFFLTRWHALRVRRAEQALARERDFSNGVVDTVDAMVVVLDRQGRVVRFNQACERISGKRLAEVRDRPVWEVMVPEGQREQVRAVFEQLLDGRFPNHYENHWFTPDGEPRLIAWSNTTLKDADGRVSYVIATGIDITEQRVALAALRSSQEKYQRLLETANDAIFVADAESGRIVEANSRAGELMGKAPEALVGLHQSQLHPAEERERYKRIFQQHLATGHVTSERLYIEHRGGREVPVEISASVMEAEGRRLVVGIFRDISQRARVEDQLRKLSRVVEASPNPIVITDADGHIEYANPRFYEATGYRAEEVLGRNPRFLKSGETPPDEYRVMWETLGRGETWFGEFCNRKKDGQLVWWMSTISPIRDADGAITHFVSIAEDIGELKYAENTIRHLAYYDPLTELPNRSLFKDRLEQAADAARYQGQGLALLFIDLDRFKAVNDTLGHRCGDDLLRAVAERLKGCAAPGRTLARLGGDEFAVIQPAIREPDEVVKAAEEILAVFNEPFDVAGQEVVVTVSIGITLFPQDTTEVETLISNADLAMFRAKEVGRNTYEFYTADMNAVSFERLSLHASLKRALEREEFEVYYQPKIDLVRGRVSGMEALVRWRHPEEGLVSPGRFIPVAEETGLIVPLGEWVLDTACCQARQWQVEGHEGLTVSVNLSAQQFHRQDLSDRVARALEESGLAPECLELEITETDVMQNAEQASEILYRLKVMGVRLSIDDFGTGYSSLNYLKRFPIDVLKVDQSFVRDVNDDPDDASIARSIIALAHSMRLTVVAEGVETAELLNFFRDEGCEEVQGFYFARPVPADEFEALLADPAWLERLL